MKEKILEVLARYKIPIILGCAGAMLFVYGLISSSMIKPLNETLEFTSDIDQNRSEKGVKSPQEIIVDVAGAVKKPGVYHVAEDARFVDAIHAAGGMTDDVDKDAVAKRLNLAAKLVDGSKIYIPPKGEIQQKVLSGQSEVGSGASEQININTASENELDTLPGVGKVTAGKIINGRPYATTDELLSKKIVSKSVFEKIKEQVSAY
jgi:competence protein ComEA